MLKNLDSKNIRIQLWSSPRNISTTLMYSFAQHSDTKVLDEPLYAHYLISEPSAQSYHPAAKDILRTMEHSGKRVVENMLSNQKPTILFFKQMTHHLIDLNLSFLKACKNIILTRHPKDMLLSYTKVIERPKMSDVGFKANWELIQELKAMNADFIITNTERILNNPENELQRLCLFCEISFEKSMLIWPKGPKQIDGCWARYWYKNVHQSEGFKPFSKKEEELPEFLLPLYKECMYYYEKILNEMNSDS